MLKVWGRKTSSNVQKVMWAIGDLGLAHERVDIGGPFGGNKEPAYLAMNPNGLVPTLEDGDVMMWESNTVVRYLAGRYGAGKLEPADLATRARASQWMDWPEKRDAAAIAASQAKTTDAMIIFDAALAKRPYAAGDAFSMGDIPVGIMVYRFRQLVPQRPPLPNLERWYAAIEKRQGFKDHVAAVPLT